MGFVRNILSGVVLGIANVIPGVSGGTMAVVFGIYDRLIGAVTLNVKKLWKEMPFLLPVGIGLIIGIFLFSKVVTWLFLYYPMATDFFFIGIILGSIPMLYKRAWGGALGLKNMLPCIAGFAVMVVMLAVNADAVSNVIVTEFSAGLAVRLFFSAAAAAVAMIIPGISGSFLMLVLGVYATIIAAVSDLNLPLLIPTAFGVFVGLLGGAWLVRFLMSRVPLQTYAAILGLVAGSVLVLYPGFEFSRMGLISVVSCIAGAALSYFSGRSVKKA